MNKSILKTIIGGILFGTFVFFTGPLIFIILILKFIFTPFGMGRMMMGRKGSNMGMPPFAFANKVRNMSDEDYMKFQTKMESRFNGRCNNQND